MALWKALEREGRGNGPVALWTVLERALWTAMWTARRHQRKAQETTDSRDTAPRQFDAPSCDRWCLLAPWPLLSVSCFRFRLSVFCTRSFTRDPARQPERHTYSLADRLTRAGVAFSRSTCAKSCCTCAGRRLTLRSISFSWPATTCGCAFLRLCTRRHSRAAV